MNVQSKPPRLPNVETFQRYDSKLWTLIPLHRPDATSKKRGRVYKDGKRPLHFNWTKQKYVFRDVLKLVTAKGLNAGIRLRRSQLVLDVDPRNGGTEGFENLVFDFGLDPSNWPHVKTGSGGSHFYLRKPVDLPVVDTLDGYPGVEFKSFGRQVVAAGSVHPDTGQHYEFDSEHPDVNEAPEAPKLLLEAIKRPERTAEKIGGGQYDQELIAKMLATLDPTDFRDHASWFALMCAVHHASNGDARHEFIEWSCSDPKYANDAEMIGRRFDSLHADAEAARITYKSLNKVLRDHGGDDGADLIPAAFIGEDEFPDDLEEEQSFDFEGEDDDDSWKNEFTRNNFGSVKASDPHNLRLAYKQLGLELSYDAFQKKAIIKGLKGIGPILSDSALRRLRFLIKDKWNFLAEKDLVHEFTIYESQQNSFHPVKDYFASLKWDGVPRLNTWLIDYAGAEDTDYVRAVSALPFIAAVRRIRQPGAKYDEMLVLESEQGKEKSSALEIMAIQKDWFTDSFPLNADGKRTIECLAGKLICECAELHGMKKTEIDQVKATLSRNTDRARLSYGRMSVEEPRQSIFIGTANERNYLKDPTGNRRFWPIGVKRFDLVRLKKDRDQIWAEAVAREAAGESIRLDRSLWGEAAKEQRKRSDITTDPFVDAFRSALGDMEGKLSSEDAWRILGLTTAGLRTQETNRRFGATLRFIGWKPQSVRIDGKAVQGFVKGKAPKKKRIVVTRHQDGDVVARYEDRTPSEE